MSIRILTASDCFGSDSTVTFAEPSPHISADRPLPKTKL